MKTHRCPQCGDPRLGPGECERCGKLTTPDNSVERFKAGVDEYQDVRVENNEKRI